MYIQQLAHIFTAKSHNIPLISSLPICSYGSRTISFENNLIPNHVQNTKIKKQSFSTPSPKNMSNNWGLSLDFTSTKQQLTFAVHRDLQREVTVSKSHRNIFAILLKLPHLRINILLFILKHHSLRYVLLLLCLIITQSCGALRQLMFVTGLAQEVLCTAGTKDKHALLRKLVPVLLGSLHKSRAWPHLL